MSRMLSLLALLAFAAQAGFSQMEFQKGVVGGVQLATWVGSNSANNEWTTQYAVGAFAELSLPFGLAIHPEVLYSAKGNVAKLKYPASDIVYSTVTQSMTYLEVPVLVKYTPSLTSKVLPHIVAGLSFGQLLDAKYSEASVDGPAGYTNKDKFPGTDIGTIIGIGASFPKDARGDLSFDVRYNFGQSTLDKNGKVTIQNNTIAFLFSAAF